MATIKFGQSHKTLKEVLKINNNELVLLVKEPIHIQEKFDILITTACLLGYTTIFDSTISTVWEKTFVQLYTITDDKIIRIQFKSYMYKMSEIHISMGESFNPKNKIFWDSKSDPQSILTEFDKILEFL